MASKETYYSVKRDLVQCQKRASKCQKRPVEQFVLATNPWQSLANLLAKDWNPQTADTHVEEIGSGYR
jgi:hypothetical protein